MAVEDIALSLLRPSGRIAPVKVNLFTHIIMASLAGVGPLLRGISPGMDVGDKAHGALRVVYALLTDWNSESCFAPASYSDGFCFYGFCMQRCCAGRLLSINVSTWLVLLPVVASSMNATALGCDLDVE